MLAEYIVGKTLDCLGTGRQEWAAWDFVYKSRRIEVKSAGYVQSWNPTSKSRIVFGIRESRNAWCHDSNKYLGPGRHAHIYIFCLNTQLDPQLSGNLDESDWKFFVFSTDELISDFGSQKTVGLDRLQRVCQPVFVADLKASVDAKIATIELSKTIVTG